MAAIVTDSKHYSDIAAAIRAKTESSETYKPSEMAEAIEAIETGVSVETCTLTIQSNLGYASLSLAISVLNADGKIDVAYKRSPDYADIYTVNNAVCGSVCCVMDNSMRGIANASSGTEAINSFSGSFTFKITAPANGTALITIDP